jgi:predicted transcriptional regulator
MVGFHVFNFFNTAMTETAKRNDDDAWFIAQVEEGIRSADAGELVSHEDAKRIIAEMKQRLQKRVRKKFAGEQPK